MEDLSTTGNETGTGYVTTAAVSTIAVMSVVGTIGNSLVLYVFRFRFEKSPFTVLVTFLAVFDLLVCFGFMPTDAIFMASPHLLPYRGIFCKIGYVVMDISSVSSSILLCGISYIRAVLVCSPLDAQLTMRHAHCVVLMAIISGLILGVLSFFAATDIKILMEGNLFIPDCAMGYNEYGNVYLVYYVLMVLVILAVMILTTSCYTKIAIFLICQRQVLSKLHAAKMVENDSDELLTISLIHEARRRKEAGRRSRTINTVLMMFTVSFIFAVSYSPHFIVLSLCFVFKTVSCKRIAAYPFLFRSVFISNVANFLIYGWFSVDFRKEISSQLLKLI